MTLRVFNIPPGYAGTYRTVEFIASLARTGARDPRLKRYLPDVGIPFIDSSLRNYWVYADEENETLRGVDVQIDNFTQRYQLIGDCDDAAVVAAALAIFARSPNVVIVAVRRPDETEFSHVFVEAEDVNEPGTFYRLDPTAPTDANYDGWERMEMRAN